MLHTRNPKENRTNYYSAAKKEEELQKKRDELERLRQFNARERERAKQHWRDTKARRENQQRIQKEKEEEEKRRIEETLLDRKIERETTIANLKQFINQKKLQANRNNTKDNTEIYDIRGKITEKQIEENDFRPSVRMGNFNYNHIDQALQQIQSNGSSNRRSVSWSEKEDHFIDDDDTPESSDENESVPENFIDPNLKGSVDNVENRREEKRISVPFSDEKEMVKKKTVASEFSSGKDSLLPSLKRLPSLKSVENHAPKKNIIVTVQPKIKERENQEAWPVDSGFRKALHPNRNNGKKRLDKFSNIPRLDLTKASEENFSENLSRLPILEPTSGHSKLLQGLVSPSILPPVRVNVGDHNSNFVQSERVSEKEKRVLEQIQRTRKLHQLVEFRKEKEEMSTNLMLQRLEKQLQGGIPTFSSIPTSSTPTQPIVNPKAEIILERIPHKLTTIEHRKDIPKRQNNNEMERNRQSIEEEKLLQSIKQLEEQGQHQKRKIEGLNIRHQMEQRSFIEQQDLEKQKHEQKLAELETAKAAKLQEEEEQRRRQIQFLKNKQAAGVTLEHGGRQRNRTKNQQMTGGFVAVEISPPKEPPKRSRKRWERQNIFLPQPLDVIDRPPSRPQSREARRPITPNLTGPPIVIVQTPSIPQDVSGIIKRNPNFSDFFE
eukprot:TRINITY_DN14969_c0_g1_i1.p1 TRINITY_DN14969_c0_g1~~TRINITY_DN14969_c0_g1_i1.p1  ORF type:complete len:664 (-),score=196.51 TRINITY_DN14969_c0_g1_i1:164-2155(-)